MELADALLWLAGSGGTLTFVPSGMADGAPAHANAGYVVEAAVPDAAGGREIARAFAGSFEARRAGLSPAVVRAIADLMTHPGAAPQAAVALRLPTAAAPAAPSRAAA